MGGVPSNYVSRNNPTIPVDQGIYEESSTQKTKLGDRLQVGDRVFYYARLSTSANVVGGDVLVPTIQITGTSANHTVVADTSALGKRSLVITAGTALAANYLAEGYIAVGSAGVAGAGSIYRIKSHAAISSAGTGTLNLYDSIPIATQPASVCQVVPNLFGAVKIGTITTDYAIGVAPISGTTGNYFWLQTWGMAAAKHAANNVAGNLLSLGATGGLTTILDLTTNSGLAMQAQVVAKNLSCVGTQNNMGAVILNILP